MIRPQDWYAGIMSGTSLDGIDLVVGDFAPRLPRVLAATTLPLPASLRTALLKLCAPGDDHVDLLGWADAELGNVIADGLNNLLGEHQLPARQVRAIGSHGQTIRHRPDSGTPFSLQIGDPNIIAERTGITVVADFRRRDMAAGGQGAPLVPAFHAYLFGTEDDRVVVNIGGMANITLLPGRRPEATWGFDTGPGNVLVDAWAQRHLGTRLDDSGNWGAQGQVNEPLLQRLLAEPYFQRSGPKSTGREQFHLGWVEQALQDDDLPAVNVQATLTELTARSITAGITELAGLRPQQILVSGGGRHNRTLMQRLGDLMPRSQVQTTDQVGLDGDWMEAMAFAWLARCRLEGVPGNLPAVTGAAGRRVLGAIYAGGIRLDE